MVTERAWAGTERSRELAPAGGTRGTYGVRCAVPQQRWTWGRRGGRLIPWGLGCCSAPCQGLCCQDTAASFLGGAGRAQRPALESPVLGLVSEALQCIGQGGDGEFRLPDAVLTHQQPRSFALCASVSSPGA